MSGVPTPPIWAQAWYLRIVRVVCGVVEVTGDIKMFKIPNSHDLMVSVQPVDAKGAAAPVDGVPAWTVSDPTLARVEPATNGLTCKVVPLVPSSGTFQVRVVADANLGQGVRTLEASLELQIGPGEAVSLSITVGDLVPKAV